MTTENPNDIHLDATPDLPMDVISNILSRLPVKSLLQFKCASKPWYALIGGKEFITLHLKRSMEKTSSLFLVLIDRSSSLLSVRFDDDISSGPAVKLPFPFKLQNKDSEVVGTCNGLICVSDCPDSMTIYNPSTRRFRRIPVCSDAPGHQDPCYWANFGFGYDSIEDDYKILRIDQYCSYDDLEAQVRVFSFRTNSWKKIKDFPYSIAFPRVDCTFVSGALHWNVTSNHQRNNLTQDERIAREIDIIAAFDVHDETFNTVPLPDFEDDSKCCGFQKLGVCGENLMFVNPDILWSFHVWVMKEYGKMESWTKLARFKSDSFTALHVMPLLYVKDKSQVLVEDARKNEYFWYDLKCQGFKDSGIRGLTGKMEYLTGFPHAFGAKLCVESLVWCGDGPVGGGAEKVSRDMKKGKGILCPKKGDNNMDDFLSKGFKLKL